jgi:hypothetical protein
MESRSSYPLVILIDLDGTIIGDITPQIMSYELTKALKTANVKYSFDIADFKAKLKTGLVRPYFDTFIKALTTTIPNVEFFVYTASEKSWAEFVIKNIEQSMNIKFNRPIFTRNFCINQDRQYKKSLQFIFPTLLKCFKKKYGVMFSKKDLSSNILIIDNNNVYQPQEHKHLIVCPSYNYRIPENIVCNIKANTFKTQHTLITSVLKKYIPINSTNDYNMFQKDFYLFYVTFLEQVIKNNLRYANDKFWLHLKDVIISQNIQRFDERNVKYITNVLRQRSGNHSINVNNAGNQHAYQHNNQQIQHIQQKHFVPSISHAPSITSLRRSASTSFF